jgi:hypothetical protein
MLMISCLVKVMLGTNNFQRTHQLLEINQYTRVERFSYKKPIASRASFLTFAADKYSHIPYYLVIFITTYIRVARISVHAI